MVVEEVEAVEVAAVMVLAVMLEAVVLEGKTGWPADCVMAAPGGQAGQGGLWMGVGGCRMGQREESPVWLLGCGWKEVMVSPDPDPDCVEWNPD